MYDTHLRTMHEFKSAHGRSTETHRFWLAFYTFSWQVAILPDGSAKLPLWMTNYFTLWYLSAGTLTCAVVPSTSKVLGIKYIPLLNTTQYTTALSLHSLAYLMPSSNVSASPVNNWGNVS